jgi:transcriptional regulator with XRE-family HTH domain
MLSETLNKELSRYGIGKRLRALRLRKKLGLVELGHHTGLSPALLSKIETGRLYPTLPTLQRIALVFSVGLDHFFVQEDPPEPAVVHRRKERIRLPDRADSRSASFEFESLDFKVLNRPLSAYYAEFRAVPAERAREHAHPGVELLYVLSGQLGLKMDGNETVLKHGDSIYFEGSRAHAYRRIGKAKCSAVIVTVPRSDLPAPLSAPTSAHIHPPPKASGGQTKTSPRSDSFRWSSE